MTAMTSRTCSAKPGRASTCALAAALPASYARRVREHGGDLRGQELGIDGARLSQRIGGGIVDALRQPLERAAELDVARERQRRRDEPPRDAAGNGFGKTIDARRDDGAAVRRRFDRDEPERLRDRRVQQTIDTRIERRHVVDGAVERHLVLESQALRQLDEAPELRARARDLELDVERRAQPAQRGDGVQHDCETFHGIQARGGAELDWPPVREALRV